MFHNCTISICSFLDQFEIKYHKIKLGFIEHVHHAYIILIYHSQLINLMSLLFVQSYPDNMNLSKLVERSKLKCSPLRRYQKLLFLSFIFLEEEFCKSSNHFVIFFL